MTIESPSQFDPKIVSTAPDADAVPIDASLLIEGESEKIDPLEALRDEVVNRWSEVTGVASENHGLTADSVRREFGHISVPPRVYQGVTFQINPDQVQDDLVEQHIAWLDQEAAERVRAEKQRVSVNIGGRECSIGEPQLEAIFYWQTFNQAGNLLSSLLKEEQISHAEWEASRDTAQEFLKDILKRLSTKYPDIIGDNERYSELAGDLFELLTTPEFRSVEKTSRNVYTLAQITQARGFEREMHAIRSKYGLIGAGRYGGNNPFFSRLLTHTKPSALSETTSRLEQCRQADDVEGYVEIYSQLDIPELPLVISDIPAIQRDELVSLRGDRERLHAAVKRQISDPLNGTLRNLTIKDLLSRNDVDGIEAVQRVARNHGAFIRDGSKQSIIYDSDDMFITTDALTLMLAGILDSDSLAADPLLIDALVRKIVLRIGEE